MHQFNLTNSLIVEVLAVPERDQLYIYVHPSVIPGRTLEDFCRRCEARKLSTRNERVARFPDGDARVNYLLIIPARMQYHH
jgi:hypothetical protein